MTSGSELKINKNTTASKTAKFLIIKEEVDEQILTSKILKKSITGHNLNKKGKNNNQLWWAERVQLFLLLLGKYLVKL